MRFDHVGILVDDLEAAVGFARDVLQLGEPDEIRADDVQAPLEMRGRRHLWTKPETAGGWMLQLTERADA